MTSVLLQPCVGNAIEAFNLIRRGIETYENFGRLSSSIKRKNELAKAIKKLNTLEVELGESLNALSRIDLTDDEAIEILDIVFRIYNDLNKLIKEINNVEYNILDCNGFVSCRSLK